MSGATPSVSSVSHGLSSSAKGGIVGGILAAAVLSIAIVGFFFRRRRGARILSDQTRSNGDTEARGKYTLWQNNEKLLPYDMSHAFGQPRVATPTSETVLVAGPEYHNLP